jgi:hypothetical protein
LQLWPLAARGLFLCATHHDVPHRLTAP